MGIGGSHHPLSPPIVAYGCRWCGARTVEAVEGSVCDVVIELRPVSCERLAVAVKRFDREPLGVGRRPEHKRWYRADQDELGHAALAVTGDVPGRFATTRRMPDMDRVAQIQLPHEGGYVGSVMVHVMATAHLLGSPVATAVMGNDAIAFCEEEKHLVVPVISAQRPPVMEHDRLRVAWPPILEENPGPIFCRYVSVTGLLGCHGQSFLCWFCRIK
ncbi:hypothetical protein D9M70_466550 [compost metagenome]